MGLDGFQPLQGCQCAPWTSLSWRACRASERAQPLPWRVSRGQADLSPLSMRSETPAPYTNTSSPLDRRRRSERPRALTGRSGHGHRARRDPPGPCPWGLAASIPSSSAGRSRAAPACSRNLALRKPLHAERDLPSSGPQVGRHSPTGRHHQNRRRSRPRWYSAHIWARRWRTPIREIAGRACVALARGGRPDLRKQSAPAVLRRIARSTSPR
jgi:hypothetical protein